MALHRAAVVAAILAIVVAACGSGGAPSTAGGELTIYGAASLRDALDAVKSAYEAAVAGTTVTISTDSSAALETQIEQGAPADVFLSADQANPAKLVRAGLADGDPVTFAANELALVVPSDNPAGITTPADLARPGVKVVAAGDSVPVTAYAKEVVANLASQPGYPSDFAAGYERNIVSREDNVKALLAKIELGEGDAGFVYRTDAAASSDVSAIALPASANVTATYDGVVVGASPRPAAARAFLAWLAGPDGRAILARFGFVEPAS